MSEIKFTINELNMPNEHFKKILEYKLLQFNQYNFTPFKICKCKDKSCKYAHPNNFNSIPTCMIKCPNAKCENVFCPYNH